MNVRYKCTKCGCIEFISQLNQYSVFQSYKDVIQFKYDLLIDDEIILYCRDCSEPLEFSNNDVVFQITTKYNKKQ